jgi:hypothetical protein
VIQLDAFTLLTGVDSVYTLPSTIVTTFGEKQHTVYSEIKSVTAFMRSVVVIMSCMHCCYIVVTLFLNCHYTVVTLLSECCYTATKSLSHCYCNVVTLLSHCCHTVYAHLHLFLRELSQEACNFSLQVVFLSRYDQIWL